MAPKRGFWLLLSESPLLLLCKLHSAPDLKHASGVLQPHFFQETFGVYQSAWDTIDTENILVEVTKEL